MRTLVVVLVVAACGGSPHPPPTHDVVRSPEPVDPHTSRAELARAALAKLGAGDADALVALAPTKDLVDRSVTCDPKDDGENTDTELARAREDLAAVAANNKGLELEVLELDDTGKVNALHAGKTSHGCTARVDLQETSVRVKVRAHPAGGQPYEATVRVGVVGANDRWYLAYLPPRISSHASSTEAMKKLSQYADDTCACRDSACLTVANDGFQKWSEEMVKSTTPADFDADDMKQIQVTMKRLGDCAAKLRETP